MNRFNTKSWSNNKADFPAGLAAIQFCVTIHLVKTADSVAQALQPESYQSRTHSGWKPGANQDQLQNTFFVHLFACSKFSCSRRDFAMQRNPVAPIHRFPHAF